MSYSLLGYFIQFEWREHAFQTRPDIYMTGSTLPDLASCHPPGSYLSPLYDRAAATTWVSPLVGYGPPFAANETMSSIRSRTGSVEAGARTPEPASVGLTHSSPAGSRVWHVMGMQRSMPEWAIRQGWGGRPVRQEQAQGILVGGTGRLIHRHCH
jgi:hypothetical protein